MNSRLIIGSVKDQVSGQPVSDVLVYPHFLRDLAVTTDYKGSFEIDLPDQNGNEILLFSHEKYHICKINLPHNEYIVNTTLKPNDNPLIKDDLELLQNIRWGDQNAGERLVKRYKNPVFFTVLKMVNNKEDAEDITMAAFGNAFLKLDTYTPEYSFSTWLFRIAINKAIDHLRKRKLEVYSLYPSSTSPRGNQMSTQLKSGNSEPIDELIKEERIIIVNNFISKLKPKYRRMIELRFLEEKTYEEIAELLQMPLGTVKAQLFRAKDLLSHSIEPSRFVI